MSWRAEPPCSIPRLRGETEAAEEALEPLFSQGATEATPRPRSAAGRSVLKPLPTTRGSGNSNPVIRTTGGSTKFVLGVARAGSSRALGGV